MFLPTRNPSAPDVTSLVQAAFKESFPESVPQLTARLFADVEALFCGRHPEYAAVDLRYHDFEHTLQATACLAALLAGRHSAGVEPRLTARQFELAIAAALLHDSGYLKLRSDSVGTGAKYTYCHVLRSCSFAASYLPALGVSDHEVEAVLGAINCTGPSKQISRLQFREPVDRIIGCALATADYLGQMAAPDYPDELEILFDEFRESDNYIHLAPNRRAFQSADELITRTPTFWRKWVLPKLETDFQAVYRFLADPYPHGRNAYVDAVERNIAIVQARIDAKAAAAPVPAAAT
ncbi:MAG TPA: hypothetical protein VHE61_21430 [Opitutaceae bacterium]|nr:hypothetical protein [Opitutaceae bacterium]